MLVENEEVATRVAVESADDETRVELTYHLHLLEFSLLESLTKSPIWKFSHKSVKVETNFA